MIKIRDLTFEYFDRDDEGNLTEMVNAIRGINFDAGEGEFIVVAGVNGSGKSTFAKILNRLLLPIEGTVLIGGLDAMQEENIIPIRKMVGMVFQNPDDQLIGSVVEEDVAFGAENISVPHKELVKRVEDALAQVGLAASMRIEELSGGGKQKVAIAGVLAMKPRYIVLDEATSMLDPKSRRDVLQLMKELQKQVVHVIERKGGKKPAEAIRLGNTDFDRRFTTLATDEQLAGSILPPDAILRILQLPKDTYLEFAGNQLVAAIYNDEDLFEMKDINVNDGLDEYREKCRKELAELLQILDKLIYVASR